MKSLAHEESAVKQKGTGTADSSAWSGLLTAQVALLCCVVFLSPLVAGRLSPIPSLSVQVLIFVATILWVVRAAKQGSVNVPGGWIVPSLVIFFILLAISAVDSVSLHATLRELINVTSYLLVFLMISSLRPNRQAIYAVLASLALSALLVGVLGLKEYLLAGSPGWRTFSTFFNPDFLAGFMVLMLPIALAWYLSRVSAGIAGVAGLSAVLIFAGILMSGSRFGAIAAAGGVIVFLVLALLSRSVRKAQLVRASLLILTAVVVFLFLGRPLAGRISSVKAESHSAGFRIHTWKGTARMAAAHPLNGTGLGTFEVAYPKYAVVGYTKLAHNTYLQLAAEVGPLASAALVVLLISCALPPAIALARRRIEPDLLDEEIPRSREFAWMPESGLMVSGLLGGAASSMARNLVDSDWYVTAIGISFWAVLGAAVALGHPGAARVVSVTQRRIAVTGAVLVLVALGMLSMLAGELCAARGEALWTRNPDRSLNSWRCATKVDPLSAEHHRRLGAAYLTLAHYTSDPSYADRAREELRAAIRLEPTCAKNYYRLGRVYEYYPRNEEAIRAFRAALERHPNAPEVMFALARRCEEAGRTGEALAVWKRMIQVEESPHGRIRAVPELVEPEYVFAHAALGQEFERRGDKSGAEKEYRRGLERARRYEDSMKAMRPVLEAIERRDLEMERQVEEIQHELRGRLKILATGPP